MTSNIIVSVILLVVGFVLLVKGADFFVEGAADVARRFKIPGFIVGMTVVAMGTSAPECAVSITASIKGSNAMAISNVIGSNLFNLLVVCGFCAAISPLLIKKETLKREFPFSILVTAILGVMGFIGMCVGHLEGIILLVIFIIFLIWMVKSAKASDFEEEEEKQPLATWKVIVFIAGGMVAIVLGGQFVVNSAETIALSFGMSETLVGLTICSIGTSLPELVTSVVASRKGQAGMALGNVIGSNIFNVLLVAGIATAISPISIISNNLIDLIILIAVTAYIMLLVWKSQVMKRAGGISLIVIYAAYMVYICIRA